MPPAAKPSLKATLFEKVSEAFPGKQVTITEYDLGHTKLQNRGITVPQIGVKVQFNTLKGNFAIASMIPETAGDADVTQLIGRLKADAIKHEAKLTPSAVV
jgi:hypothetical protein